MKNLYVIGDSISSQYGPYLEAFVQGVFSYARKNEEDVASAGLAGAQIVNGGDSGAVLAFLSGMIDSRLLKADVLLLNCGLHDIKTDVESGAKQVPVEQYQENLKAILDLCSSVSLPVVWMRTTPCDENIHNRGNKGFFRFAADCELYNRTADEIMENNGIPAIDLFTFTQALGPDLYCDHVHFHEHIRVKQAAYISGWLTGRFSRERF